MEKMRILLVAVLVFLCVASLEAVQPNNNRRNRPSSAFKLFRHREASPTITTQSDTVTTQSSDAAMSDGEMAAFFKQSPDLVVPVASVQFNPGVTADAALAALSQAISSSKTGGAHFLVAADFDAKDIEAYNTIMDKLKGAETAYATLLNKIIKPSVDAQSKQTSQSEAMPKETVQKTFASLNTDLFFPGVKTEDLKASVVYAVRIEVTKPPTQATLPGLIATLQHLANDIRKLPIVQIVSVATTSSLPAFPCVVPGTGDTPCNPAQYNDVPDLQSWQEMYFGNTEGIHWNAMKAKNIPGSDAAGVRVIDIEDSFDDAHVNLPPITKLPATGASDKIDYPTAIASVSHGTAVLSMLVGTGKIAGAGPKGIHGLIPAATPYFTTRFQKDEHDVVRARPLAAIKRALAFGPTFGDVILLEMQQNGHPVACNGLGNNGAGGPVEGVAGVRQQVTLLLAAGAIVVEAGGNDGVDLDVAECAKYFKTNEDSIIVGSSYRRENHRPVLPGSAKGARIDVYAIGEQLAAAGDKGTHTAFAIGDPAPVSPKPGAPHRDYTATFGGTSGASPQVTATVAAMAGVMKHFGLHIPAGTFRRILRQTSIGAPLMNARPNSGGQVNADAAVSTMYDSVRKCRYCQYAVEVLTTNLATDVSLTDLAARTCSKLTAVGDRGFCSDFVKLGVRGAISRLALDLPGPLARSTASGMLEKVMHTAGMVTAPAASANDRIAISEAICSLVSEIPCLLDPAHHTTWANGMAGTPYLANAATRAQVA